MDIYIIYVVYIILILLILACYMLKFNIHLIVLIRKYYHYYGKFIKIFLFIIFLRIKYLIKIFFNFNLEININLEEMFSIRTYENLREIFFLIYRPVIPTYMIVNLSIHFPWFLWNANIFDLEHRKFFLYFFYYCKIENFFFFFRKFFLVYFWIYFLKT